MSNRASVRAIAKARLEAMGVPHINKVFGLGIKQSKAKVFNKNLHIRKIFAKIKSSHPEPLWRRVTTGSLAREGIKAQMNLPGRKKFKVAQ